MDWTKPLAKNDKTLYNVYIPAGRHSTAMSKGRFFVFVFQCELAIYLRNKICIKIILGSRAPANIVY